MRGKNDNTFDSMARNLPVAGVRSGEVPKIMNMFQKLFGFKSYADFGRNEGEMEPIKLDMGAIRKRLGEAMVVKYEDGLHIVIPRHTKYHAISPDSCRPTHFSLDDGYLYNMDDHRCDWVIRPGDRCQISHDNYTWYDATFVSFRLGEEPYIIKVDINGDKPATRATFIRHLHAISPEKKRILEEIEKAIAELKRIEQNIN